MSSSVRRVSFRPLHRLALAAALTAGVAASIAAPLARWDFAAGPFANAADVWHGGVERVATADGSLGILDGFSGWIQRPAAQCPAVPASFAVSAWFAPAAYPWSRAPLVDASDKDRGFRLELDAHGRPQFTVRTATGWQTVRAPRPLELMRWHLVVATRTDGEGLALYVDGERAAEVRNGGKFVPVEATDWLVGRNRVQEPPEGGLRPEATAPVFSYLDGALDHLEVGGDVPTAAAIADAWHAGAKRAAPPLQARVMPAGPAGAFGAFATTLSFYPQWDRIWRVGDAADVVVRFGEQPGRLVFWRGTSYIPHWVTENGIWYTNEFNETWGNMRGSGEPMSDKQCRYSRVQILESGEARAVVHWRYALTDVYYQIARADPATGWGDWSDEVYTIYPDGTAVRDVTLHTSEPEAPHEWHEAIVVMGPGQTPESSLEPAALTVAGATGESVTFSWAKDTPPWTPELPKDCCIELVHTRSRLQPFAMVRPQDRGTFNIFAKEVRRDVSMFPWWNHWPTSPNACDGRFAFAADRPSHSSLSNIAWEPLASGPGWIRKVMLTGLTDRSMAELRPLLSAWATPPAVKVSGGAAARYEVTQRAWILERPARGALDLAIAASAEAPVENLAFVVRGWGDSPVSVRVDGRELSRGADYRAQWRRGLDGTDLVLWIRARATQPLNVTLEPGGA